MAEVRTSTAGLVERRDYDALGRLLLVKHSREAAGGSGEPGPVVFGIEYDLGPDGNRIGTREEREGDDPDDPSDDTRWEYQYDALGRLVVERMDDDGDDRWERDVAYEYDADSNRVRETKRDEYGAIERDRTYHYERTPAPESWNTQRLSRIDEHDGGSVETVESFTWTAKGEMASKTGPEGTRTMEWGPGETLEAVNLEDGRTRIEYDYDDTRTLVARRVFEEGVLQDSERYLVEDGRNLTGHSQILAELDAESGAPKRFHAYEAAGIKASTTTHVTGSESRIELKDGLGTVRSLVRSDSTIASRDYTAFGDLVGASSSEPFNAFTGEHLDGLADLAYHRARWYAPSAARWLSADPSFDFPAGHALAYGYVGHNPTNATDPSGTISFIQVVAAVNLLSIVAFPVIRTIIGGGDLAAGLKDGVMSLGAMLTAIWNLRPILLQLVRNPFELGRLLMVFALGPVLDIVEIVELMILAWRTIPEWPKKLFVEGLLCIFLFAAIFSIFVPKLPAKEATNALAESSRSAGKLATIERLRHVDPPVIRPLRGGVLASERYRTKYQKMRNHTLAPGKVFDSQSPISQFDEAMLGMTSDEAVLWAAKIADERGLWIKGNDHVDVLVPDPSGSGGSVGDIGLTQAIVPWDREVGYVGANRAGQTPGGTPTRFIQLHRRPVRRHMENGQEVYDMEVHGHPDIPNQHELEAMHLDE